MKKQQGGGTPRRRRPGALADTKRNSSRASTIRKEVEVQNNRVRREVKKNLDSMAGGGNHEKVFTKKALRSHLKVLPEMNHAPVVEHRLSQYMRTLADPWEVYGVKCPVNYNPAPTYVTHTARTSSSNFNLTVALNSTTQIILVPGMNTPSGTVKDSITHTVSQVLAIGAAGNYVAGPLNSLANGSTPGSLTQGLALGTISALSNTVASAPLPWDNSLPYLCIDAAAQPTNRTRWKLVSMGFRIINETPQLSLGGNVLTVQPTYTPGPWTPAGLLTQASFERYPSFYDHGTASKRVSVSWIPRVSNLAYNEHTANTSAVAQEQAAIVVWINNPTAAAQTYSMEIVCNWEIGGSDFQVIGTPSVHQPADRSVVEPAISVMTNMTHTAADAHNIAAQVSKTVGTHVQAFAGKVARAGASAVGGFIQKAMGM